MIRFIATGTLVIVGVLAWQIGSKLSADAIGLAVGVTLGIGAGIPVALLLMLQQRTQRHAIHDAPPPSHQPQPQPPVIVIVGGQLAQPPGGYEPHRSSSHGYAPALPDLRRQIDAAQPAAVARWADVEDW